MDELGYGFDPKLSGDTIESWRYRKAPPTLGHLETLARLIVGYGAAVHNRDWLETFLTSADHPYSAPLCDELFPPKGAQKPTEKPQSNPPQPAAHTLPPPPLKAYEPPPVQGFVGRQLDLTRYKTSLENQTFAAISGMAGVGKTTLMSVLAAELAQQHAVFWHSFANGTVDPLMHRLAGFVASLGRPELWEMMEAARASGDRPPAVETLFDMLGVILGELDQTILLCFDDLQFVDEDVRLQQFLIRQFEHQNVNVLVTTRRYPSFFPAGHEQQLSGLTIDETADLLHNRAIQLPDDLITRLNELTGGNGAFLTLAAVVLKDAIDAEEIIGRLAREDDVERFLMEEVNDRLANNDQRVMEAVAVLSGHPGTRDVLEEMLNMRDVNRTLRSLADQYLLLTGENRDGERVYHQHQIIQSFFYDQPRRSRRRDLHMRAADFYEHEEPDAFRAMLHHAKAGQVAPLVSLADAHFYDVVNQGEGEALQLILADVDIQKSHLPEAQMIKFLLARGRLRSILGELNGAEADLMQAADRLNGLPQTAETDSLKGEVCLSLGDIFERQDPQEALSWVQRGLTIVAHDQTGLAAQLKSLAGTLNMHMGNFGESQEFLMDALETSPENRPRLKLETLRNLGSLHLNMGQLAPAQTYMNQANDLAYLQKDHHLRTSILMGSGPIKYMSGDWQGAIEDLTAGLELAQRLGDRELEASVAINLGSCHLISGNDKLAKVYLSSGLCKLKPSEIHIKISVLIRLAELSLYQQNLEDGFAYADQAVALCQQANDQNALMLVYVIQAELNLIGGCVDQAKALTKQALSAGEILGDKLTNGGAYLTLGRCYLAEEAYPKAEQALSRSLSYFKSESPHDVAIVQLELGRLKRMTGQKTAARQLIDQAHETFLELGAKRQLAESGSELSLLG